MARLYLRFQIDGAIPLKAGATTSMTLAQVADYVPDVLKPKLVAIRQALLDLKASAAKVNSTLPNQENTIKFTWHICSHEVDNSPCVEKEL